MHRSRKKNFDFFKDIDDFKTKKIDFYNDKNSKRIRKKKSAKGSSIKSKLMKVDAHISETKNLINEKQSDIQLNKQTYKLNENNPNIS